MRKLALIAAAGIVLAGCGSSHRANPAPAQHSPYPAAIRSPLVLPSTRLYVRGPRFVSSTHLAIATWGSGSCPNVPAEVVVQSPHAIEIGLAPGELAHGRLVAHERANAICTSDLRPTAMLLAVDPKQIDVHHPVTINGLFYPPLRGKKPQISTAPALKS